PHRHRYRQPAPTAENSLNPSARDWAGSVAVSGAEFVWPAAGGRLLREPCGRGDGGFESSSRPAHIEWTSEERTNVERTNGCPIRGHPLRTPSGSASSESSPCST